MFDPPDLRLKGFDLFQDGRGNRLGAHGSLGDRNWCHRGLVSISDYSMPSYNTGTACLPSNVIHGTGLLMQRLVVLHKISKGQAIHEFLLGLKETRPHAVEQHLLNSAAP